MQYTIQYYIVELLPSLLVLCTIWSNLNTAGLNFSWRSQRKSAVVAGASRPTPTLAASASPMPELRRVALHWRNYLFIEEVLQASILSFYITTSNSTKYKGKQKNCIVLHFFHCDVGMTFKNL